jgi:hypothetical protein
MSLGNRQLTFNGLFEKQLHCCGQSLSHFAAKFDAGGHDTVSSGYNDL